MSKCNLDEFGKVLRFGSEEKYFGHRFWVLVVIVGISSTYISLDKVFIITHMIGRGPGNLECVSGWSQAISP